MFVMSFPTLSTFSQQLQMQSWNTFEHDHKAAGMDGLPVKCIKIVEDIISLILCIIFNNHIENGTFP